MFNTGINHGPYKVAELKLNKSREHLRSKCLEIAGKSAENSKNFKLQSVITNDQILQHRGTKTKAIHWFPFPRIDGHPKSFVTVLLLCNGN